MKQDALEDTDVGLRLELGEEMETFCEIMQFPLLLLLLLGLVLQLLFGDAAGRSAKNVLGITPGLFGMCACAASIRFVTPPG